MTKDKVRFTVDLAITDGKLDEFEAIAQTMIAATKRGGHSHLRVLLER